MYYNCLEGRCFMSGDFSVKGTLGTLKFTPQSQSTPPNDSRTAYDVEFTYKDGSGSDKTIKCKITIEQSLVEKVDVSDPNVLRRLSNLEKGILLTEHAFVESVQLRGDLISVKTTSSRDYEEIEKIKEEVQGGVHPKGDPVRHQNLNDLCETVDKVDCLVLPVLNRAHLVIESKALFVAIDFSNPLIKPTEFEKEIKNAGELIKKEQVEVAKKEPKKEVKKATKEDEKITDADKDMIERAIKSDQKSNYIGGVIKLAQSVVSEKIDGKIPTFNQTKFEKLCKFICEEYREKMIDKLKEKVSSVKIFNMVNEDSIKSVFVKNLEQLVNTSVEPSKDIKKIYPTIPYETFQFESFIRTECRTNEDILKPVIQAKIEVLVQQINSQSIEKIPPLSQKTYDALVSALVSISKEDSVDDAKVVKLFRPALDELNTDPNIQSNNQGQDLWTQIIFKFLDSYLVNKN